MPRHEQKLLAVLGILILIRASLLAWVIVANPGVCMFPDSPSYEEPARAMLQYGRFAQFPREPLVPETLRTPGYPLLIAAVYGIFGESRQAVLFVQALLDALLIVILFFLGRRLWSANAGFIAAVVYALNLSAFDQARYLLSDSPFVFIMTVVLLLGCKLALPARRPVLMALAFGSIAAFACLVRPILYYWAAILAAWLVFLAAGKTIPWRAALAGILPWILIVGGWQVRNKLATGDATFSQIQNVNLYLYRAADILSRKTHQPFAVVQEHLRSRLNAETAGLSQTQIYREMKIRGVAVIKAEPKYLLQSQVAGALKLIVGRASLSVYSNSGGRLEYSQGVLSDLFRMSPADYWRKWFRPHTLLCIMLFLEYALLLIVYACLIVSAVIVARRREMLPIHLFLLVTLVYFVAVSAGPEAYSRLRLPIEPILALYAAFALTRLRRKTAQ